MMDFLRTQWCGGYKDLLDTIGNSESGVFFVCPKANRKIEAFIFGTPVERSFVVTFCLLKRVTKRYGVFSEGYFDNKQSISVPWFSLLEVLSTG